MDMHKLITEKCAKRDKNGNLTGEYKFGIEHCYGAAAMVDVIDLSAVEKVEADQ